MKKLFTFVVVGALMLPLMMTSCKDNNTPDTPQSADELLSYWIDPIEGQEISVREDNLVNFWKLNAIAQVENGKTYARAYLYEDRENSGYRPREHYYYDLDKSLNCHSYMIDTVETADGSRIPSMLNEQTTWSLSGDIVEFPTGLGISPYAKGEMSCKVHVLEQKRLVLAFDQSGETYYFVFSRELSLPELPLTMEQRLMQYSWRIVGDSVWTRDEMGNTLKEAANIGVIPLNTILTFTKDEVVVSEGTVGNEKARFAYTKDVYMEYVVFTGIMVDSEYELLNVIEAFYPYSQDGKAVFTGVYFEDGFNYCKFFVEAVK